ncbi:MAG: DNA-directed RNA polymerase subunit beta' [Candidatus Anoxychlamydiales bacterium]|nr:DNA-directed RNA polymerase subunit beta' [Candidatus Anoxychlamydiales bacterium]
MYESEEFTDSKFDKLSIKIASEDVIRNTWSRGEIKKPETINYRTFKPEKGGLFCEKIFGPTRDWECACGKYKKIKHKGIVCDRCGVEVTLSKVRRERMAHIDLAVPVVHIWFFKTMPSKIGNILGLSVSGLERVIYYEEYIVTDPKETELERKQFLNDAEYREAQEKYGPHAFVAKMGAEAIYDLLKNEDLNQLVLDLKEKLRKTKSMQARIKLAKRLKIVEGLTSSPNNPEWMVLSAVPVIPPDLRPLVPLDGGRFATSDLNDLYRRVINRNNRLKSILKLKTPDVIIRNEKRMLQESVDALFDNGRHGHPVMGAGNRPLKSLSEMLKGKQGRFRQNLLGKRVDYSGRSVIVIGPDLKFNQCGIPKQMALELFEPFIVKKLKDQDYVYTIRSAKKMIQKQDPIVWDVLDEIIKGHPVLLNRAPTLHRLGIQAFEPVLIEGKAIRIHPLVTTAFNADFDGDQMAVHIPLSIEAQLEAKLLMMAPDNIFLPSSGKPVTIPSQDMILGLYYLMLDPFSHPDQEERKIKIFKDREEVLLALNAAVSYNRYEKRITNKRFQTDETGKGIFIHEKIKLLTDSGIIETTPGRVVFNTIVPKELGFQNYVLRKKRLSELVLDCHKKVGLEATVRFLDDMKNLGFAEATKAALSMGVTDVTVPQNKSKVIEAAYKKVAKVKKQYADGVITENERKSKIISIWTEVSDSVSKDLFKLLANLREGELNPLYLMMDSGARGNKSQVKQLGALRGLMAKPSGEIIEYPIISNFREGLTVLEYFISTHGARKGLADTALKTADSGYLTRRLVDVSQDVIVTEIDCGTLNGIEVSSIKQGQEELLAIKDRIFGRTICEDIYLPGDKTKNLAKAGDILTIKQAESIDDAGIEKVKVRSPLTCESSRGICAKCYGNNLALGTLVGFGEAVGIIAAQSIGEPGTQLTMRTFHIGGIASASISPRLIVDKEGILIYKDLRYVQDEEGNYLALNKNGTLNIVKDEGRSIEEYKKLLDSKSIEPLQIFSIELGTKILFENGVKVNAKTQIAEWEQYSSPIICERKGYAKFEDLVEGISTQKEVNKQTNKVELIVKQYRGELHPQISVFLDKECKELIGTYAIPSGAIISIREGDFVKSGQVLAKLPREAIKTKDITGGLPRVAELFEARRPKVVAEIAKIDGEIDFEGVQKNKKIVVVIDKQTGMKEEHLIPLTKHLIVQKGDIVVKGQQLTDGLVVPHEILDICGVRELQKYLVNEVQEVYRLQGVDINDKHIEIIVRQMLQKVRVTDPGDTTFLYGEDVDKKVFHKANRKTIDEGGKPAQAAPVLLGITKASLGSESFVSAASFQETTKVLTGAATDGAIDYLRDFKSNLIMGHIIPGGTGFESHLKTAKFRDMEAKEEELFTFDDDMSVSDLQEANV